MCVAATRAFSYMRLVALASGVLVFLGLVLYLQARQRSQAVASSLAARMGLRATDRDPVARASSSAAITFVQPWSAASSRSRLPDRSSGTSTRLPSYPPGPALVIPLAAIVGSAVALVAVALAAGACTSWASRRTNMAEALRVV